MIILDTSFLIDFFRNAHLASAIPADSKPATTVISYYEVMSGIKRIKSPKESQFFSHFFSDIEILPFNLSAAGIAADIGGRMASHGNLVNAFDICIAGIAIANHAKEILTSDTDFLEISKYSGLEVRRYNRAGNSAGQKGQ